VALVDYASTHAARDLHASTHAARDVVVSREGLRIPSGGGRGAGGGELGGGDGRRTDVGGDASVLTVPTSRSATEPLRLVPHTGHTADMRQQAAGGEERRAEDMGAYRLVSAHTADMRQAGGRSEERRPEEGNGAWGVGVGEWGLVQVKLVLALDPAAPGLSLSLSLSFSLSSPPHPSPPSLSSLSLYSGPRPRRCRSALN
jgi:hypothetical protein